HPPRKASPPVAARPSSASRLQSGARRPTPERHAPLTPSLAARSMGTHSATGRTMEFGYYILNTYEPEHDGSASALYGRYLEPAEAAEAAGFDAIWATEHHFRHFGGMTPSPQLLLTAISQRTRRARLGSSVSILPLHHPLRIAEDFAVLDVLSDGRLEFG